jgi:hypothetical protein
MRNIYTTETKLEAYYTGVKKCTKEKHYCVDKVSLESFVDTVNDVRRHKEQFNIVNFREIQKTTNFMLDQTGLIPEEVLA